MTVKGNALFRRSRVRDPLTGAKRRISGDAPVEADVSLTYDMHRHGLRMGITYVVKKTEIEFKVDEIDRDILSDRVDAFVEYKPSQHWPLRQTGRESCRSRGSRNVQFAVVAVSLQTKNIQN